MIETVAGNRAGAIISGDVHIPGRLAVVAGLDGDFMGIEVDQMRLFAAVRVMAGITGGGRVVEIGVQVFGAQFEMGR